MRSRIPDRIKENIPESVAIVGCGGVGSWVAILFGQMRDVERIALFDEDNVEESNLERTPYRIDDINTKKSEALKKLLKERQPELRVTAYDHLTDDNELLLNLYDLKVVGADSSTIRAKVLRKDNAISCGYDIDETKDYISVSEQMMWTMGDQTEADGYTVEPSWSGPAMLSAFITVHSVLTNRRPANVRTQITDRYKKYLPNGKEVFDTYDEIDDEENGEVNEDEDEDADEDIDENADADETNTRTLGELFGSDDESEGDEDDDERSGESRPWDL